MRSADFWFRRLKRLGIIDLPDAFWCPNGPKWWMLGSWIHWEAYCNVQRLGRKIRLPEARRKVLWSIFEEVRERLSDQGLITWPELFKRLTEQMAKRRHPPYDFAVVDEAQDISVPQLRFLAALGGKRPNSLFFAGDLGPADISDTLFLEGAGRGYSWAVANLACQLSHLPSDQATGGSSAGAGSGGCGRQRGRPAPYHFRI